MFVVILNGIVSLLLKSLNKYGGLLKKFTAGGYTDLCSREGKKVVIHSFIRN